LTTMRGNPEGNFQKVWKMFYNIPTEAPTTGKSTETSRDRWTLMQFIKGVVRTPQKYGKERKITKLRGVGNKQNENLKRNRNQVDGCLAQVKSRNSTRHRPQSVFFNRRKICLVTQKKKNDTPMRHGPKVADGGRECLLGEADDKKVRGWVKPQERGASSKKKRAVNHQKKAKEVKTKEEKR